MNNEQNHNTLRKKENIYTKPLILLIAVIFAIFSIYIADAAKVQKDTSEKLIRIHIIANSDSAGDQKVKLKVRDALLSFFDDRYAVNIRNREEAVDYVRQNSARICERVESVTESEGYSYTCRLELVNDRFPECTYDGFSLPSGEYLALKVKLGEAKGKNWWCVLFPPLCCGSAETYMEAGVDYGLLPDEYINSEDNTEIKIRFKILEIIKEIKELFM